MRKIIYIIIVLIAAISIYNNHVYAQQEEGDLSFAKKALNDGFYDLAVEKLQFFLNRYPNSPHKDEVYLVLGKCFYKQGELKKALYEFQLITNKPQTSDFTDEALYWIGEVYFKSRDFATFITAFFAYFSNIW